MMPKCHFPHDAEEVATLRFDQGCICYPHDRLQHLCLQHARDTTPIGVARLIAVLDWGAASLLRDMGWSL